MFRARIARLSGRPRIFDKALGLRIRALTGEGDGRDLVADHFVNAPDDNVVDACVLNIANLQFGLHYCDFAGHVFADIFHSFLAATRRSSSFSIAALPIQGVQQSPPYCTIASSRYKSSAALTSPRLSAATSCSASSIGLTVAWP